MRPEKQLVLAIVLCAALIGSALMLRDATVGSSGEGVMARFLSLSAFAGNGVTGAATSNASVNQPPQYVGPNSFSTAMETPLIVDLAPLFSDADGDALTFLVAEEDHVGVTMDGSAVTLTPSAGFVGERVLTIVVSDGTDVLRQPVKLVVAGNASPAAEETPAETPQPTEEEFAVAPVEEPTPTATPTQTPEGFGSQDFGTSVACTSCADCTTCLATGGNTCTASGSFSAAGTCVTIGADNTTFDCAGATMTFDGAGGGTDAGVTATNRNNVTVRDCIILDNNSAGTNSAGVEFLGTNNSAVTNTNITANGSLSNFGINLGSGARNNTIENGTIRTFGTSTNNYGIEVNSVHGNRIRRFTVSTNGTSNNNGLDIIAAHNNTFETVNITTAGASSPGIAISIANGTQGNNITLTNPVSWLSSDTGSFSNLSNTTFWTPNGSVFIAQTVRVNSSHDVSKTKLNITLNRVFVNSTNLQFLNTSAQIALFGISFADPRPNVDFEDDGSFAACSPPQCTEVSYAGGVFVFNVSSFTTYNSSESSIITSCSGTGVVMNTSTTLAQDLSSNESCIFINASNTFLNCSGFTISFDSAGTGSDSGVRALALTNVTVQDCVIRDTTAAGSLGMGINFSHTNDSLVKNNTIFANGTSSNYGVSVKFGSGVLIENNTVRQFNGTSSNYGILIDVSSDNSVRRNIVSVNGTTSNTAIEIQGATNNVSNNNVTASGASSSNFGISVTAVVTLANNNISNNDVYTNGSNSNNYGIRLSSALGTDVVNNTVRTNGSSANHAVFLAAGGNNTVHNNRFVVGVYTGSTSLSAGVSFSGSVNNNVTENDITSVGGNNALGILFQTLNRHNRVANNVMRTFGNDTTNGFDIGIRVGLGGSSNNNNYIGNNTIITNGSCCTNFGFRIESPVSNNTIANNTIVTSGGRANYAIQFIDAGGGGGILDNTFVNNTFITTGLGDDHGISVELADMAGTTFTDNRFFTSRAANSTAVLMPTTGVVGLLFNNTVFNDTGKWILSNTSAANNFSNTTFEMPDGMIVIPGVFQMNGTQEVIKGHLNITSAKAFLNSTNLTFMNRSAQITLRGITFVDPRPNVDFEDDGSFAACDQPQCTEISYAGGVFVFNVSSFTTYNSSEGAVPEANFTTITNCAVINNSVKLANNISGTSTCVRFNNHSIFLDCAGFSITYGTSGGNGTNGVFVSNFGNARISNCTVIKTNVSGANSYAIAAYNASGLTLANNTIRTNGTSNNEGVHIGSNGTQTVQLVSSISSYFAPYSCTNATNINFCETCMSRGDVNCVSFGSRHCTGGPKTHRGEMVLSFNLTAIPTGGKISTIAGENFYCDLNNVRIVPLGVRVQNRCGFPNTAIISSAAFVVGVNNLTCTVSGSGKHRDNGFRLSSFSYEIPASPPVNITVRNNTVIATGGNSSYGISLETVNATVANNTILTPRTAVGKFGYGIYVGAGASGVFIANNTISALAFESDGIYVNGALNNTLYNNSIVNATLSSIHLERALNNTLNASVIALQNTQSSLFIAEPDGNINYTTALTIVNSTFLGGVVTVSYNRTRVDSTAFGGQQFNRSARIDLFSLPFGDSLPGFDPLDTGAFLSCAPPRCTATEFNETTSVMSFNVSSFTTYAAIARTACGDIDLDDNTTAQTVNVINDVYANATCFNIMGDNTTLDCGGFAIYYGISGANGSIGVNITSVDANESVANVTVRNCVIVRNNASGSSAHGIAAINATLVTLLNNNITTRGPHSHGILLLNTENSSVLNNTIIAEDDALRVEGAALRHWATIEVNTSNSVDGRNLSYFGGTGTSPACPNGATLNNINTHHVTLVGCTNVVLNQFNASDRITLVATNDTWINNSRSVNNSRGIAVFFAQAVTIYNTTVSTAREDNNYGVQLVAVNFTNITSSRISTSGTFENFGILATDGVHNLSLRFTNVTTGTGTNNTGIVLNGSHATIIANNISARGIDANRGIFIQSAFANITDNNITTNGTGRGMAIEMVLLENSTIANNTIIVDTGGIFGTAWNTLIRTNTVRFDGAGVSYSSSAFFAGHGVSLLFSRDVNVENNTLTDSNSDGSWNIGIIAEQTNTSRFINNTIRTQGSSSDDYGTYFPRHSNYNIIENNSIVTSSSGSDNNHGISMWFNSSSNNITRNSIVANGTAEDAAIYLHEMENTTIVSNTLKSGSETNPVGIYLDGSLNFGPSAYTSRTHIAYNNITVMGLGGSSMGIEVETARYNFIENNSIIVNASGGCCSVGISALFAAAFTNFSNNNMVVDARNTTSHVGIDGHPNSTFLNNNVTITGASSSGITSTDNITFINNTVTLTGLTAQVVSLGASFAAVARNSTTVFVGNRFNANATDSIGIRIRAGTFIEVHKFNDTVINVSGTWIQTSAGSGGSPVGRPNISSNFSNTTFASPNGSIRYPGTFLINFTDVDVTQANLNITFNRAFVNISNVTNTTILNQSAIVVLRHLTFGDANPIVDFDHNGQFEACPDTVCTDRAYVAGTLQFNVTQFSVYSSMDDSVGFVLTKTDSPDPVSASAQLNYTITLSVTLGNASNVTLTENYPAQVIFLNASPSPLTGTNNTFVVGNLTNGSTFAVNISVLVHNISNGTVLSNFANISFQNMSGVVLRANVTETTGVGAISCNTLMSNTTLTQDIVVNGSCMNIGANLVTLDCSGYTVRGNGTGIGVMVGNRSGVTIKNCVIEQFVTDLHFDNASNETALNNTMRLASEAALRVSTVSDALFQSNNATSAAGEALRISGGANLNFTNNLFASDSGIAVNVIDATGDFAFFDGFEDGTLDPFGTQGNAVWNANTSRANTGSFSAMSGNITDSQNSEMIFNVTLPNSGTISFARNVSSESGFDFLRFYIDDVQQNEWSGELGWSVFNYSLGAGYHNFSWYYFKDSSVDEGVDAAWVDDVNITASGVRSANVAFRGTTLVANGTWARIGLNNTGISIANTTFANASGSITVFNLSTAPVINVTVGKLNIGFNRAFLNATNLSFLNLSARIALNGLTSSDPGPTVDLEDDGSFATCAITRCTEESYANGVFLYNVTSFTTYSSAETAAGNVNVTLTKLGSPDPVNASAFLNYTVVVNITSNNASNVTLTDLYPAQVIFLSSQPSPTNGNHTFILGNLSTGTSFSVNISVLVNNGTESTVLNNTANISYQNTTGSLLFFNVTANTTVNAGAQAPPALACGVVINQSTNVTQDITANGTCLIVNGSNVDLFCAGGRIFYNALGGDSTFGVFVNGRTNVTIRNCVIIDINVSGAFGHGIFLNATNGSTLLNDTVKTNGTSENFGIFLQFGALGNRVLNNTIETQGSGGANYGIYVLQGSAQNNITGNSVRTNGTNGNYGIHVRNGSDSTLIANNSIRAQGDAQTNVGVNVLNSSQMNITANSITTNGTFNNFGVILQFNVSGSVVANNVVSANGNDTNNIGIYLVQDVGANNVTGNTVTTSGTDFNIGINLERNATRNLMQGNSIATQGSVTQNHGIRLIDASFSNVTGNTITTGRSTASTNQGVRAIESDSVVIAQNAVTVSGTGSSAGLTILGNVSGGLIFNNTVTTGNGVFDEGIDILLNVSGARVIGNVIVANGTTGSNSITLEINVTGTIVANNTFTSTGNTTSFGIWLQLNASNNQLINNTFVTGGSANNHGIRIETDSNNNSIIGSNITTTASASYGVNIQQANGTAFVNTRLVSTEWIVTGTDTLNNFTNTTFQMPDGSITAIALAQAIGPQNVTRAKLNITLNRSFMNSTNLTFLNVTGQVLLRGIALTDPKPVIDTEDDGTFSDCAVADCQELSYANSVYVFNVSHFTSHAAGENSSTPPPPASSGGQGGGGGGAGSGSVRSPSQAPAVAPEQQVAPKVQPLACAEDWECQDWSPCTGTQSRTCVDRNECDTRESRPALSKPCVPPRVAPETERPAAPLAPKSLSYGPRMRPCAMLALSIDGLLIIAAVLALLLLLQRARGRDSRAVQMVLDIVLVLTLIPLLAQRGTCTELLPLQYLAFIALALCTVLVHVARQLNSRHGGSAVLPRAPKLPKPARVKQLPASRKALAVPAPPTAPKKEVIIIEKSEPRAIARLRQGPSVWQRLADVTRSALKPKPRLPQVPEVRSVKGIAGKPAQLPKKLQRTLDTTFRKAKVTDIPDLRSELGAIASSEDLLREFNKSVRKMKKK